MAPNPAKKPQLLVFDTAKFQQMSPPFHVRVERMEGNAAHVVPIPVKPGQEAPGPGWESDDVLNLEQGILASFGGGMYRFQITDASNEQMSWTQMYPINTYPKKPLAPDAMGGMNGGPPPAPPPQNGNYGMPVQWPVPQQFGYGAPPAYNYYPPPQPGWPQPGWPPQQPQQYSPRPVDEVTRLRQEAEAARLTAMEERHKAELQRVADEQRRAIDELRRAAERPKVDEGLQAKLEHEREERRKAEADAERARFEATLKAMEQRFEQQKSSGPSDADLRMQRIEEENRRRDDQQRQETMLREMREDARRREDLLMAQINSLKENRGPDPMMTFLLQQMQSQADSAKEIARVQAEASKENARIQAELQRERTREQEVLIASMKPFMMAPAEMARMMSDKDSSQHQFVRSMATTFNDVAGVMRDWFSNMAQMVGGQGESPVVGVIKDGIEGAKEMFNKYNDAKAQVAAAQANVQREYVRAQQPQPQPQQPQQTWQPPPPVAQSNGLNGAAQAPANGNGAVQPVPVPAAPSPVRKGGKTDEEWFGMALPDVREMRGGVALYLASIAQDPPDLDPQTKMPKGFSPDRIAQLILTASQIIEAQKVPGVLAFEYLFKNEMYNDLVEVLLPDATPAFRTDAVRYLFHRLGQGPNPATVALPANPPVNGTGAMEGEDGRDDDHDGKELAR